MSEIVDSLTPIDVSLNDILLDPNNPRFLDVASNKLNVNEERYAEERIQDKTLSDMAFFEIESLKQSILELGFLPIDKIVVRKWKTKTDASKYVVVEGNRRVAALKKIYKEYSEGRLDLDETQLNNYTNLSVLLVSSQNELYFTLIPGLRHVSGIKQWGVYQQSKLISTLREENGYGPSQAAASLGISTRECNRLYRAFKALKQAQSFEDYEDEIDEKKFSYFEEALKNAKVKEWLDWDDTTSTFRNAKNLELFISWMIGEEDGTTGERMSPRLNEAKSVRLLNKIMDTSSFEAFINDKNQKLEVLEAEENIKTKNLNWAQGVKDVKRIVEELPTSIVKNMSDEQKKILNSLIDVINNILEDNKKLNA